MRIFRTLAAALIAIVASPVLIAADGEADIGLLAEIIEIDAESASRILKDQLSGIAARAEGDRLIESGEATLIECLFVRTAPDQSAAIGSVEELLYGTEGDPPEIPNTIDLEGDTGEPIIATNSTFTAFEMREIGISWEVEPALVEAASAKRKHEPGVWVRKRQSSRGNTEAGAEAKEAAAPDSIDLKQRLDWVKLQFKDFVANRPGLTPDKHPTSHKWFPRFRSVTQGNPVRLAFGKPSMIACVESPLSADRYALVFFTAWHLGGETAK